VASKKKPTGQGERGRFKTGRSERGKKVGFGKRILTMKREKNVKPNRERPSGGYANERSQNLPGKDIEGGQAKRCQIKLLKKKGKNNRKGSRF